MKPTHNEIAVFGGGCFWCTEAIFQRLRGVESVQSGYAGGSTPNPSYEEVSTGETGHAEVLQITFDPAVITYEELLDIFFHTHDPTTLNRQGADVGTQYRSVILTTTPSQHAAATAMIDALTQSGQFADPIVTEVKTLEQFYPAESMHANYYNTHANAPYCQVVISPKLSKLMKMYSANVDPTKRYGTVGR